LQQIEEFVTLSFVHTPVLEPAQQQALQADFASLLEKSYQSEITIGSLSVGEVLKVEKESLLVDISGKYEGVVPMKEVPDCDTAEQLATLFTAGQRMDFFVVKDNEEQGHYLLSLRRVSFVKNWETLQTVKEKQENITATLLGLTKGGMLASVLNVKGFIPASQLRASKTAEEMVGETLPVKVLEVDRHRNKLILSHRMAVFEQKAQLRAETLKTLEENTTVTGEVVKITDFGVFIDINGVDGLLPLSEITWQRIKHPADVLTLGQVLTVTVLTIDHERQRISLSLKRMQADPWSLVAVEFTPKQRIEAAVSKQLVSGVLVELMPGVEAFCPYAQHGRIFEVGVRYPFEVLSIAPAERRVTLAYRPAETAEAATQKDAVLATV
jgi:small subunit ribosomal protein S1